MKLTIIKLAALAALAVFASGAHAGVLGSRHVGADLGYVLIGDDLIKEEFDGGVMYSLKMRFPVHQNVDIAGSIGQGVSDGKSGATLTDTSFVALAQGYYDLTEDIRPYVGAGIQWANVELKHAGSKVSDSSIGFAVGGGVEMGLTPTISVRLGASYHSIGDNDDILAGGDLNLWIIPELLLSAGLKYGLDSGNAAISAGFAVGF